MVFGEPESFIAQPFDMASGFHAARDCGAGAFPGPAGNKIQNRKCNRHVPLDGRSILNDSAGAVNPQNDIFYLEVETP